MKRRRLLMVEWVDSCNFSCWTSIERVAGNLSPLVIHSVGWLISENDRFLLIAAHMSYEDGQENQVTGTMLIPKAVITKRRTIRVVKS